MKRLLTIGLGIAAILFCGLYLRERNRPPKEVERIVERRVEVPKEVIKEVPLEKIIEREVKVPVEVVKEIPAPVPQEYINALDTQRALFAAKHVSTWEALEGVRNVRVEITGNGLDKTEGAVSAERLKTRAELKLRQLGVPIKDISDWTLEIVVIIQNNGAPGDYNTNWSCSITPQLVEKDAFLARYGKWFATRAIIYTGTCALFTSNREGSEQIIMNEVDGDLEQFANRWLKANGR